MSHFVVLGNNGDNTFTVRMFIGEDPDNPDQVIDETMPQPEVRTLEDMQAEIVNARIGEIEAS